MIRVLCWNSSVPSGSRRFFLPRFQPFGEIVASYPVSQCHFEGGVVTHKRVSRDCRDDGFLGAIMAAGDAVTRQVGRRRNAAVHRGRDVEELLGLSRERPASRRAQRSAR
jgi:hypothetical protein